MSKSILTVIGIFTCIFLVAQEGKDTSLIKKTKPAIDSVTQKQSSGFKFSTSYLTNSVYNGRQDSLVTPYLTPSLGYYDASGFYAEASLSYLASSQSRIDLVTIEAGYDFSLSKRLTGEVYGSKLFYNKNSTAVMSQIQAITGGSLSYDAGFLSFSVGSDIAFSKATDILANYGVSHPFLLGSDSSLWTIEPSFKSNFGSQNFYDQQKKAKKKGVGTTIVTSGSTSFVVLDYEFSLPVSYDGKTWGFSFTPTYAIPQNPISLSKPNGTVVLKEKLSNVFYAEFSVYFKF